MSTKKRKIRILNLRSKLTAAVVAVALIPLLILSIAIMNQSEKAIIETVGNSFSSQVRATLDGLLRDVDGFRKEALSLAVNPSIEQLVVIPATSVINRHGLLNKSVEEMEAIMEETRNLEANSRTQTFLQTSVAEFDSFTELIVTNLDGLTLAATHRPERFVHSEQDWFLQALEEGTYIGKIQYLPSIDELGIPIATTVYRSTTGKPAGVLRGLIPLSRLAVNLVDLVEHIEMSEAQLLCSNRPILTIQYEKDGPIIYTHLNEERDVPFIQMDDDTKEWSLGKDTFGNVSVTAQLGSDHFPDLDHGFEWTLRVAQPTKYSLAQMSQLKRASYIIVAVAVLIIALISIYLTSRITRPILELAAHAQGLAGGRLRQYRPTRKAHDETGALTDAFNAMTRDLARLLKRVHDAAVNVASASQQISAGMEEMAAGTQNQAQDIQAGTEEIEAMSEAMSTIDKQAQQAAELSENAYQAALEGQTDAESAVNGMLDIKASVDQLGEQTKQIEQILGFIQEIAEQTNLLALNAAIEAARAGEHGRGFAVVAEEVRELAERSSTATTEIRDVLVQIQNGARNSIESVEDGQALVNQVNKALQQIAAATESTAKLVKDISTASVEQTTRTNEAVALFESISHITEQTAAGAEETAASSQSLSEMAQQLQAMLDEFRQ